MKIFLLGIFIGILIASSCCTSPHSQATDEITSTSNMEEKSSGLTSALQRNDSEVRSELKNLFSLKPNSYKASYAGQFSDKCIGNENIFVTGDNKRVDYAYRDVCKTVHGGNGEQLTESRWFLINGDVITCNHIDTDWLCATKKNYTKQMTSSDPEVLPSYIENNLNTGDTGVFARVPDKMVAGVSTKCFNATVNPQLPTDFIICFTDSGVPLYITVENANGKIEEEAYNFSIDVPDSEFIPPAEPTEPIGQKPPSNDDKSELLNLLAKSPAEYMMASHVHEQNKNTTDEIYYTKGDNRIRIDLLTPIPGVNEEFLGAKATRFLLLDGKVIHCILTNSSWVCLKNPDERLTPTNETYFINLVNKSSVVRFPDKVIAGVSTKCFAISLVGINCLTDEGLTFFSQGWDNTTQEAYNYSLQVSDSEFIPPAEPKD